MFAVWTRFFSIFDTDQLGKIGRQHDGKSAFQLVTLPNISAVSDTYFVYVLREPRYIWLRKFAKIVPQTCPPTSVTIPTKRLKNFATSRSPIYVSFQQITFKLSNFSNFKTLFPIASTDFPQLAHVKSWKKPWKGLLISEAFLMLFYHKRLVVCDGASRTLSDFPKNDLKKPCLQSK